MKSSHIQSRDVSTMNGIIELSTAFQQSKVLLSACELDIFSILGNELKTAKEVAHELSTDDRATEKLMNALCSLSLLKKSGDQFTNTRSARWYLVKESPDYVGNMMHLTDQWLNCGSLTESIRTGKSSEDNIRLMKNKDVIERRLASMNWRAMKNAPEIIDMIKFNKINSVLDLGGGSGAYSIQIHKTHPEIDLTIFDQPEIIPFTEQYLKEKGYENDVKLMSGNFFKDDIGSGYDMIFLSMVFSKNSLFDNINLGQRLFRALNPDGQIFVHDYSFDDSRTMPVKSTLESLNNLMNTESGEVYTKTDMWIILKESWFRNVKHRETTVETTLTSAEK